MRQGQVTIVGPQWVCGNIGNRDQFFPVSRCSTRSYAGPMRTPLIASQYCWAGWRGCCPQGHAIRIEQKYRTQQACILRLDPVHKAAKISGKGFRPLPSPEWFRRAAAMPAPRTARPVALSRLPWSWLPQCGERRQEDTPPRSPQVSLSLVTQDGPVTRVTLIDDRCVNCRDSKEFDLLCSLFCSIVITRLARRLSVCKSSTESTLQSVLEEPVIAIPNELEQAFRAQHRLVFRTAYRVTGNAADAEDVLQTVFLRLLRRNIDASPMENPESYLRRAAVTLLWTSFDLVRPQRPSPNRRNAPHAATR